MYGWIYVRPLTMMAFDGSDGHTNWQDPHPMQREGSITGASPREAM